MASAATVRAAAVAMAAAVDGVLRPKVRLLHLLCYFLILETRSKLSAYVASRCLFWPWHVAASRAAHGARKRLQRAKTGGRPRWRLRGAADGAAVADGWVVLGVRLLPRRLSVYRRADVL